MLINLKKTAVKAIIAFGLSDLMNSHTHLLATGYLLIDC